MSTAGDIILSIRKQIPDPVDGEDPTIDGRAFTAMDLVRWINDAGRCMPIIRDWFGLPSIQGQDVYPLPTYIHEVEQVWYDLLPLTRNPEADSIFTSKVTGRSWWFGPHSIHATPRLYVSPAPDRAGQSTTLNGGVTATALSVTAASASSFKAFGYFRIGGTVAGNELCRYANVNGTTGVLSNVLRGQGGTSANAWATATVLDECNIFFKCLRLPVPLTKADDPIEIPESLWPMVELYVLAKVRETEQDHNTAQQMLQQFFGLADRLTDKGPKGLRQGLQVGVGGPGDDLLRGRIYIP